MSAFDPCKRCWKYQFNPEQCRCQKMFFKNEDWGDEWQEKWHMGDLEDFAQTIASQHFFEDPGNLSEFKFEVLVKFGVGEEKRFVVTGEPDVIWTAAEKPMEEKP